MNPELLPKIINTVGLSFDIVGAWLVACEVLSQYKDNMFETQGFDDNGTPLVKNRKFETWERKKYFYMKVGLFFLTVGFALQIAACWAYSRQNKESAKNTSEITRTEKPKQRTTRDSAHPPRHMITPETTNPTPDK